MLIEYTVGNDSSMLIEEVCLIFSKLVYCTLLLAPLAPLLPNSIVVVQML